MMEIITRTMDVTERINGSLLFFSLLVFCATWLFSLFYFKTKIFNGVLIFIFFNKTLN